MDVWIIKLGGSIITAKQARKPQIRRQLLQKLCAELARNIRQFPDQRFIILHGAGSLGHPVVHDYGLQHTELNPERVQGVSRIIRHTRRLSDSIATQLSGHGLHALPLQTSALFADRSRGSMPAASAISHILENKGIPILGGDIIITEAGQTYALSADVIAVKLAQALPTSRLLFASDIAGIYQQFPPEPHIKPYRRMNRQQLQELTHHAASHTDRDVTGGMVGKLQALLPLQNTEITIFDGRQPDHLTAAFHRQPVGTTITL